MNRAFVVDAICLQIAWFGCAFLQDKIFPWIAIILLIQLLNSPHLKTQWLAAIAVAAAGTALETAMIYSGFVTYNSAHALPIWLPLLWLIFAFTLGNSLRWLSSQALVAKILLGGLFGTLTYQSAVSFEALELSSDKLTSSAVLFAIWAVTMPVLLYIHRLFTRGKPID